MNKTERPFEYSLRIRLAINPPALKSTIDCIQDGIFTFLQDNHCVVLEMSPALTQPLARIEDYGYDELLRALQMAHAGGSPEAIATELMNGPQSWIIEEN